MVNLILINMCSVKIRTAFSIFWVLAKKKNSDFGYISPSCGDNVWFAF